MKNELKEKYGLFTAISMVVGIVIGSGVFFKAEKVLTATNGNLPLGILAWLLGGLIMMVCAYSFATLATRYKGVNGVVDYAESVVGKPYAYIISWFVTFIYYPAITSVLAWVSARYTGTLFGFAPNDVNVMIISFAYMIIFYALNTLSPLIAGKFQVATTVIKLIPLLLMAVIGTVVGLSNGMTLQNFTAEVAAPKGGYLTAMFSALVASAFAYDGWIVATSINAEIKNSKRNLPIALILGTGIIVIVYILYYVGLAGSVPNAELMGSGEQGVKLAFEKIFGSIGGVGLYVLVIISCLGTLNGLMVATTRSVYSMAARNRGIKPKMMSEVSETTNMPLNASIIGLLAAMFWLLFFYGANLAPVSWFGKFGFDSSELPIVTLYAMYIPIYFMITIKEKDLGFVKRFVMPSLAIICSMFMMVAAVFSHKISTLWYLIVFAVIMLLSIPFYKAKKKD